MSKYSGGRYLDAISLIKDLTGPEKAILRHIASKIDFRDFSKSRYMSYLGIAAETSFGRNTVFRSVTRLAELGYISKTFTENHGKNSANIYRILDRIFENVPKEAKDSQTDYAHTGHGTDQTMPTVGMVASQTMPTPGIVQERLCPERDYPMPTVGTDYAHSGDEAPNLLDNPNHDIYPPPPILSQPAGQPTGPLLNKFTAAIVKPRLPIGEARMKNVSAMIHAANRPGPSDGGKHVFYSPPAEWVIAVRATAPDYSNDVFEALTPYLAALGKLGTGLITPANLSSHMAQCASFHANPEAFKKGDQMSHYSDWLKKKNSPPVENKEVDWISTLDMKETKYRLTDPTFICGNNTRTGLEKRFKDLGGNLDEIQKKSIPSR